MARFEALDLWSNISHVLVAQGSCGWKISIKKLLLFVSLNVSLLFIVAICVVHVLKSYLTPNLRILMKRNIV
jgi:hypothetical protein